MSRRALLRIALGPALCVALACDPAPPPEATSDADGGAPTAAADDSEASGNAPPEPARVVAAPGPRVAELEYDGGRFEAEFGGPGQLPTDFPDDVPIYSGSEPQSSLSAPGRGQVVHLRTGADSAYVFDYYREALASEGWEEEFNESHRGDHEIRTRKGNRVTRVTIKTDGTVTMILLSVGEERS